MAAINGAPFAVALFLGALPGTHSCGMLGEYLFSVAEYLGGNNGRNDGRRG
jgi:hypothetical protein